MNESTDTIYGRLLESVHVSGYTIERACIGLEWLLEDDRWKSVGDGFEEINEFLESINLSKFKFAVDERKRLVHKLAEVEASQRATAKALGVSVGTVNADIHPDVQNRTNQKSNPLSDNNLKTEDVQNRTPPPEAPKSLQKEPEDVMKAASKTAHVSNNSGENEWYTPSNIIEAAREVMGSIDIDPASSEKANETVRAESFYDINIDGLGQDWIGNVWLNPPYAQPLIEQFAQKLSDEYDHANVKQACVLVNNATETKWFRTIAQHANAMCTVKGRVRFIDEKGEASGAPLQGQVVLYIGSHIAAFTHKFREIGVIWQPVE